MEFIARDIPRSVPTPMGEPFIANNAASPPDEPPAVRRVFHGFDVRPKTLLIVSSHSKVWGTLVRQWIIAPRDSSSVTKTAEAGEMKPILETNPGQGSVKLRVSERDRATATRKIYPW